MSIPLPAATVLLARDSADGPEVYLVRRSKSVRFMGGVYVFPGGKVDAEDADPDVLAALQGADDAEEVLGLAAPQAAAHLVAAIRETLEEAGLLLGTGDATSARAALAEQSFPEVLRTHGLTLDGRALRYWSHWITPPVEPRRFSARFFAARAPFGQSAAIDVGELTEGAWFTPREAIARYYANELDLAPPTLFTLAEVQALPDVDAILAAAPHRPVVPYAPELAAGPSLVLAGDPLHPTAPGDTLRRFALREGRWHREF